MGIWVSHSGGARWTLGNMCLTGTHVAWRLLGAALCDAGVLNLASHTAGLTQLVLK